MTEPEHAEEHGQHLTCDSHSDKQQRRKARQGIENKELANSTARRKSKNVFQRLRVAREERNSPKQLSLSGGGNGEGEEVMHNAALRDMRHNQEVCGSQYSGEHILRDHHLGPGEAGVQLGRREDVVLCGVGQAVEEEIDGQQEDTPSGGSRLLLSGDFLASSRVVQTKSCDAEGDHQDNTVLI